MEKQSRKQQIRRRKRHSKWPSCHSCRKFLIRQLFGRQAWHGAPCLSSSVGVLCAWPAPGARTLRMKHPQRKAAFPPCSYSPANKNTHTHTHRVTSTAHRHPLPWKLTGRRKESRNPLRIITPFPFFLSFFPSFSLSHLRTHTSPFWCSLGSFGDCASGLCSPMMNDLPKNTVCMRASTASRWRNLPPQ